MDIPMGLCPDDFGWFAIVCDDFRPGMTIRIRPGVAMDRSGCGFGSDWIGLGSVWNGLDRIGLGLTRLRLDLNRALPRIGATWMQTDHAECNKSLFS